MAEEDLSRYFNLGISVTVVLYGFEEGTLKVYIQKIKKNPYAGAWSFPGTLVMADEGLEAKCEELVQDAIGNSDVYLEQLNAFGKIYRHPIGRVVDVAFYGLINMTTDIKSVRTDKETRWVAIADVGELAYDHNEVLELAAQRLKRRIVNRPIGFKLLPKSFKLSDLQALYEQILMRPLDKRNFRKKLTKLDILMPAGYEDSENPGRKPQLFQWNADRYNHYMEQGF